MKLFKLIPILFLLSIAFVACEDEMKSILDNDGLIPDSKKVEVAFEVNGKTALRNAGRIEIPLVLESAAEGVIKVLIAVKPSDGEWAAREGYDFNIVEKLVHFQKGETRSLVEIALIDYEFPEAEDREFELEINTVYGYGKNGTQSQSCKITLVSNSFVEFEKQEWLTWETATVSDEEAITKTRLIPVVINGDLTEPAKIKFKVVDNTAKEYTHFEIKSKEVSVQPGDKMVYVEVLPVDDDEANLNRAFYLTIESVEGGNLRVGKNNISTQVIIQSEEIAREIVFALAQQSVKENVGTAEIEVTVDVVAEEDITVYFEVDEISAIAGKNYNISSFAVVIPAGKRKQAIPVEILNDGLCIKDDLLLELKLKDADGAHAFIGESNSTCTLSIDNTDFPSFAASELEIEEASTTKIALSLENPAPEDIPIKLSLQNTVGDVELLTPEITIPKGSSTVDVQLRVGFTLDAFTSYGSALQVDEIYEETAPGDIAVQIDSKESLYRQLLGDYTWNCTPSGTTLNATAKAVLTAGTTGTEQIENFNKSLSINITDIRSGYDATMTLHFRNGGMYIDLGSEINAWYSATYSIKFYIYTKPGEAYSVPVTYDAANKKLSLIVSGTASAWVTGYYYNVTTGAQAGQWAHFQNGSLTKK